jgi:hypothetical protein
MLPVLETVRVATSVPKALTITPMTAIAKTAAIVAFDIAMFFHWRNRKSEDLINVIVHIHNTNTSPNHQETNAIEQSMIVVQR